MGIYPDSIVIKFNCTNADENTTQASEAENVNQACTVSGIAIGCIGNVYSKGNITISQTNTENNVRQWPCACPTNGLAGPATLSGHEERQDRSSEKKLQEAPPQTDCAVPVSYVSVSTTVSIEPSKSSGNYHGSGSTFNPATNEVTAATNEATAATNEVTAGTNEVTAATNEATAGTNEATATTVPGDVHSPSCVLPDLVPVPPEIESELQAPAISSTSVILSFDAPKLTDNYDGYRITIDPATNGETAADIPRDVHSPSSVLPNLAPGTDHTVTENDVREDDATKICQSRTVSDLEISFSLDQDFPDSLKDPNSQEFQNLKEQIEQSLRKELGSDLVGFKEVRFEKGCPIVYIKVEVNRNAETLIKKIQKMCADDGNGLQIILVSEGSSGNQGAFGTDNLSVRSNQDINIEQKINITNNFLPGYRSEPIRNSTAC